MREFEQRGFGDDWNSSTRIDNDDSLFWDYNEGEGPFSDKTLMEALSSYNYRPLQANPDQTRWDRSTKATTTTIANNNNPVSAEESPSTPTKQPPRSAKQTPLKTIEKKAAKPQWSSSPKVAFPITSKMSVSQIRESFDADDTKKRSMSRSASSSSVGKNRKQSKELDRDVFSTSMSHGGRRESLLDAAPAAPVPELTLIDEVPQLNWTKDMIKASQTVSVQRLARLMKMTDQDSF